MITAASSTFQHLGDVVMRRILHETGLDGSCPIFIGKHLARRRAVLNFASLGGSTMAQADEFPEGPTQEEIAKRAYELYLQRGSTPGYEMDDWLAAKAELTAAESSRTITDDAESRNDSRRNSRERSAGRRPPRLAQSQQ
jgi:hypothetical protein